MPHLKSILITICLILTATVASAEIYHWVDENGVKHFGNDKKAIDKKAPVLKMDEIKYDAKADHRQQQLREKEEYRAKKLKIEKKKLEYKKQKDKEFRASLNKKRDPDRPSKRELFEREYAKLEEKKARKIKRSKEWTSKTRKSNIEEIGRIRKKYNDKMFWLKKDFENLSEDEFVRKYDW